MGTNVPIHGSHSWAYNRPKNAYISHYLMMASLRLLDQLIVNQVRRKRHGGDSKPRKGRLESVDSGELAFVSPRVSLGPGIAAHG